MDELLEVANWHQKDADWIIEETGEMVSGYSPGDGMRELVEKKIVVRTSYDSS